MQAQLKNIALSILILAIGFGQPLTSLGVPNLVEIENVAEKEIELKEESNIISSQNQKSKAKPFQKRKNAKLLSYESKCYSQSIAIDSQNHQLYLLYDTWLV